MDNIIVLVENWQMQCCGMPFKVGEHVEWTVIKNMPNEYWDKFDREPVAYLYENHADNRTKVFKLQGIVKQITANYFTYETIWEEKRKVRVPAEMKSIMVNEADGWDKAIEEWSFANYTVHLDTVKIKELA